MTRPEPTIYRSDHILGRADGELTPELYRSWGRSLGRLSLVKDQISVGSDGRESSEGFRSALKEGFADVGVRVLDLGVVPHVASLFSLQRLEGTAHISGMGMPCAYNGLRWMLSKSPLSHREQCQILCRDAEQDSLPPQTERCEVGQNYSFLQDWIDWHQQIWFDTPKVPLRIIVDPLHGPWSRVLRKALQAIFPIAVFEGIHEDLDPNYGGLVPCAQNPESIKQLSREVDIRRADMGIALDGETGCFSFCDDHGIPLRVHELSWLILQSYAAAIPGEQVLHTTILPEILLKEIQRLGGTPVLVPREDAGFSDRMRKTGAILGFDHTGRFFGRSCFGLYISFFAICWLIDFLAQHRIRLSEFRRTIPPCFATLELKAPWHEPKDIVKILKAKWNVKPEKILDGHRFSGSNGHANLREDRDYAQIVFQFEATNRQMLDQMVNECVSALNDTELALPLTNAYRVSG